MGDDPKASVNPMRPALSWQTALNLARCSPRCGARTRSGGSCQQPKMLNGRCRMHGGTSPGAPPGQAHGMWKHGLRSAETMKVRSRRVANMRALRQVIDKLSDMARDSSGDK